MKKKKCIISIIVILVLITASVITLSNFNTITVSKKQANEQRSNDNSQATTGTLINVPLDCRPVSTTNFKDLVEAAGYNYIEVDNGLDQYSGTNGNTYTVGSTSATNTELKSYLSNNNSSNTTVILNLSTYFFGGVKATRDCDLYTEAKMKENLNNLKSIMDTYKNPKYYVVMTLPSVKPDFMVIDYPSGIDANTKVEGLSGPDESFTEAFMDWQYLHYIQKYQAEGWYSALPTETQLWARGFHNDYAITDSYSNMYDITLKYINSTYSADGVYGLNELQKQYGFELILNADSDELPESIAQENIASKNLSSTVSKTYYYSEDSNGNKIRYSGTKYCIDEVAKLNNSDISVIHGVDNINDIILARDLARRNSVKISYKYINPLTNSNLTTSSGSVLNRIMKVESVTENEALKERSTFINKDNGSTTLTADLYLTDKSHTMTSAEKTSFISNVKTNVSKTGAVGVLDLKYDTQNSEYFDTLVSSKGMFKVPVYGESSTLANGSSETMGTLAVYAILQNDIKSANKNTSTNSIDGTLKTRLNSFTKVQLRHALDDGVYLKKIRENSSISANASNLKDIIITSEGTTTSTSSNVSLISLLKSTDMNIGGVLYRIETASVLSATNSLQRKNEVKIELGTTEFSLIDQGLILDKSSISLEKGNTQQINATFLQETSYTNGDFWWESDDESIATVDDGLVTAIGAGTTTIECWSTYNMDTNKTWKTKCTVTVTENNVDNTVLVTGITLTPTTSTIKVGETAQLQAMVTPTNATDKTVNWTSDNVAVATVNTNGLVTAVGTGTAVITATTSNGKTATSTITVTANNVDNTVQVTGITVTPITSTIKVGETAQLQVAVTPTNATDKTVSWTSDNVAVATVDANGLVTAVGTGTAVITVTTANGKTATSTITVTANNVDNTVPVTGITVTPSESTLKVGETASITASIEPENATDRTLIWTSDNKSVATVNENGEITAVGVGTATITVSTADGSTTATVRVNVTENSNGGNGNDTGNDNSEDNNSGNDNSENNNSGDNNSGSNNSGDNNSENNNSGDNNSENNNSGDNSSGSNNSGDNNSGANNSGTNNSGTNNSGTTNSGTNSSGVNNSGTSSNGKVTSSSQTSVDDTKTYSGLPYTGFLNQKLKIMSFVILTTIAVGIVCFIKYRKIQLK